MLDPGWHGIRKDRKGLEWLALAVSDPAGAVETGPPGLAGVGIEHQRGAHICVLTVHSRAAPGKYIACQQLSQAALGPALCTEH